MGELLRVLMRVLPGDWLNAITRILSFTDTPTNRIDGHWPVTSIYGRNSDMLFCRSAIPGEDQPNACICLQTDRVCLARQMQGHDHCAECCYSGQPGTDCIPYLNLLIERHGLVSAG